MYLPLSRIWSFVVLYYVTFERSISEFFKILLLVNNLNFPPLLFVSQTCYINTFSWRKTTLRMILMKNLKIIHVFLSFQSTYWTFCDRKLVLVPSSLWCIRFDQGFQNDTPKHKIVLSSTISNEAFIYLLHNQHWKCFSIKNGTSSLETPMKFTIIHIMKLRKIKRLRLFNLLVMVIVPVVWYEP